MKNVIRILIVDDHPIFRKGVRTIIELEQDMKVVGDVADGHAALEFLGNRSADVVLLDLDMPNMDGLEFTRVIKEKKIPIKILVLTMHKEEQLISSAMELGIRGFVSKENAAVEVAKGIRAIMKGESFVCTVFSDFLVRQQNYQARKNSQVTRLESLTPAERNVLKLIGENLSSKEIAERLFISPKTVDNHRTNICLKLNIHGSHGLLRFLIENKSWL